MNEATASILSHETIARRAEQIWNSYGHPQGRDEEIWLEAESQLRSEQQQSLIPALEAVASKVEPSTPPTSAIGAPAKASSKEIELMEKSPSGSVASRSKARSNRSR